MSGHSIAPINFWVHTIKIYLVECLKTFFFSSRFGLSKDQGRFALPQFATAETTLILKQTDEESDCANTEAGPQSCNNFRNMVYRSEDGTCNNLKHSLWGRANVALTRLLAPDYEDGKY